MKIDINQIENKNTDRGIAGWQREGYKIIPDLYSGALHKQNTKAYTFVIIDNNYDSILDIKYKWIQYEYTFLEFDALNPWSMNYSFIKSPNFEEL